MRSSGGNNCLWNASSTAFTGNSLSARCQTPLLKNNKVKNVATITSTIMLCPWMATWAITQPRWRSRARLPIKPSRYKLWKLRRPIQVCISLKNANRSTGLFTIRKRWQKTRLKRKANFLPPGNRRLLCQIGARKPWLKNWEERILISMMRSQGRTQMRTSMIARREENQTRAATILSRNLACMPLDHQR